MQARIAVIWYRLVRHGTLPLRMNLGNHEHVGVAAFRHCDRTGGKARKRKQRNSIQARTRNITTGRAMPYIAKNTPKTAEARVGRSNEKGIVAEPAIHDRRGLGATGKQRGDLTVRFHLCRKADIEKIEEHACDMAAHSLAQCKAGRRRRRGARAWLGLRRRHSQRAQYRHVCAAPWQGRYYASKKRWGDGDHTPRRLIEGPGH